MSSPRYEGLFASGYRASMVAADPYFSSVSFLSLFGPNFSTTSTDRGPNGEIVKLSGVVNRGRSGKFGTGCFKHGSDSTSSSAGTLLWANFPNMAFGSSDWCVEGWFRASAEPANGVSNSTIFSRYRSTSPQRCWRLSYTRNDAGVTHDFIFSASVDGITDVSAIFKTGTSGNDGKSTAQIFDNNWHHIACVKIGTTIKLYVDGLTSSIGSHIGTLTSATVNDDPNTPILLGASFNHLYPTLLFTGFGNLFDLDEVRISVGTGRYTAAFIPPTTIFGRNSTNDPNWSTVKLLLDFEDIEGLFNQYGSTTKDHLTNSQSNTVQYFDSFGVLGVGNQHRINSDAAFDFAASDFTVEVWSKMGAAVTATKQLMAVWGLSGNFSWRIGVMVNNIMSFQYSVDGTTIISTNFGTVLVNAVHTFAVSRIGSTIYLYLDGVQVGSVVIGANAIKDSLVALTPLLWGGNTTGALVKAIRITKGTGRYGASTYVVPSLPLPIS